MVSTGILWWLTGHLSRMQLVTAVLVVVFGGMSTAGDVVDPVDSEHLSANYGGPVEHSWLERSYHVATLDHDREHLVAESVAFVQRVAA